MTLPVAGSGAPGATLPDFVHLFGLPRVRIAGSAADAPIDWSKGTALVAYLACRPGWHARENIARMLRPDADISLGRAYLRRLIHRMRQSAPNLTGLDVEEERIRWSGQSDVGSFTAAVEAQDWDRAVELQAAPLLDGAPSCGLPALDDWIFEERVRLRQALRGALVACITVGRERGQDCACLMRRLAEEDPADESGVQFLLSQARTPLERHAATVAFENLRRRLQDEWGQEPLAATIELFDRLQGAGSVAGSVAPASSQVSSTGVTATAPSSEPLGRHAELEQLAGLLVEGDVRLLTIFGFGGVGKTLLARTLFERLVSEGRACVWVDLLAADSLNTLLDAIASNAGMPARDQSVEEHLALWLAERRLIVFLDNFEQLIPHAAVLLRLLERAPGTRFVLTSRQALRLPVEHTLRLDGLDTEGPQSPAARLFDRHAAHAGYRVTETDAPAVAAIVSHLQGLPLAIELAAHWTSLLSPASILAEIERDPGFIDGAAASLGSSRTMHSVLVGAWRRLEQAEQDTLGSLSVFLGPVELEQARAVSQADPRTLLRLVDNSLLHRSGPRGFRLHPLIRDFARAHARPEVLAVARDKHMAHYLDALAALPRLHLGCAVPPAARPLIDALDDTLKAWRAAVELGRTDLLVSALPNLSALLLISSRHEEAARLCTETANHVPFQPLGAMLAGLHATAAFRLGRMQDVRAVAESALQRNATGAARVWLELALARLDWFNSDYEQSLLHAETAVAALPIDEPCLRMMALLELGHSRYGHGQLDAARTCVDESLSLARRHGAPHWEGRARAYLGVICSACGQPQEALEHLQAALPVFRELDASHDVAFTLRCASYAHFLLRDPVRQLETARAALQAFRSAGYYYELGESQFALALALQAGGQPERALPLYHEALTRCLQSNNVSGGLRCITMLGVLALRHARPWGIALMCFAGRHPGLRRPDRQELQALLGQSAVTADECAQAERDSGAWTIEDVCGRLLERFAASNQAPAIPA